MTSDAGIGHRSNCNNQRRSNNVVDKTHRLMTVVHRLDAKIIDAVRSMHGIDDVRYACGVQSECM